MLLVAGLAPAQGSYTLFESGPVRPLALSPDGSTLFACNIPDARLEIFEITPEGLVHKGAVPVGLEPVAVAARTNGEVWVVNHLSDSVSIVDVASRQVTRTLLVGDEPGDIVFAGAGKNRAFVTAAHRGQNRPGDPQLLAGGVARSDLWVFDANDLGAALGGTPLALLELFGDTPRALAASPNGATVYAAVFHSGNQTAALPPGQIPQIGPFQTLALPPPGSGSLPTPMVATLMKQQAGNTWNDANGTSFTNKVPFSLPDHDVFVVDANATPPAQTAVFDHVGTILYNMVVNPVTGAVYVSNTDANNMDRFEGFGTPNLRGELHKARISILTGGSTVTARHLNRHIDYAPAVAPAGTNEASLGIPTDMAITGDGETLYVAAYGSQAIGIVDTEALALDPNDPQAFQPNAADHIALSAGGPGGVVLDQPNGRLYVYTRFDDGVSVVDPVARVELSHARLHDPESASISDGRRFLFDTRLASSNGEASCGVCHVFGDLDSLAWDLGAPSPDGTVLLNDNPFVKIGSGSTGPAVADGSGDSNIDFHPLKGPMTTQTLRGMEHDGPMHWRGDRSGGGFSTRTPDWDADPNALDENQAFLKFNPAFVGLLGRASPLGAEEMQAFASYALQLQLPPNPIRHLDGTLTASQASGASFFAGPPSDQPGKNCNGCHTLNPSIGAFGTGGLTGFSGVSQHFKTPQLRNLYQKVGMFGRNMVGAIPGQGMPGSPQVRGFGFLNDGSIDTIVSFLSNPFFNFPGGDAQRANVADFLLAFPSDLAPIVGQQVTLRGDNASDPSVVARLDLLVARAATPYADVDRSPNNECDLIVKGRIGGAPHGWWMSAPGSFTPDSSAEAPIADADLRQLSSVPGQDLTYTCAPPGSGVRMGIDRGGIGDASQPDGILDREQCGDVTADGVATAGDVSGVRALLALHSIPAAPGKCNVEGAPGSDPASCDVVDLTVLRRALAGLGPALSAGCNL
ncbi:MAG TPA: hypothetical protein VKF60_15280 [Myxococcota bacterium]|nr:hypothetical protein [Myxococcota bacterium]